MKITDDDKLKKELEVLRGTPLEDLELSQDSWKEQSDADQLCKKPVVSVHMVTYNHEAFIRQAIESVMMQECNFEYELVIGEDCSTDKTRNICFEYQKKYPDKIRVLYADENSFKKHQSQLINVNRVNTCCRGEFLAWLEGDDYWTDPRKLQKQVDIMRKYPEVFYIYTGCKIDFYKDGKIIEEDLTTLPSGIVPRERFWDELQNRTIKHLFTPTLLWRRKPYMENLRKFEIRNWSLRSADITLHYIMSMIGDAYFLPQNTACYRINPTSLTNTQGEEAHIDNLIIGMYFHSLRTGILPHKHKLLDRLYRTRLQKAAKSKLWKTVFLNRYFLKYWLNPVMWNYLILVILCPLMQDRIYGIVREGWGRWLLRQYARRIKP